MRSRATIWYLMALFLAGLVWIGVSARASLAERGDDAVVVPAPALEPAQSSTSALPVDKESWLILPAMPADATEADIGAEIYALVCRDCHGDRGQGLTDAFRATWAPKDQNCWQSKCHAANHPPEGFQLPRYIPAIIGPYTLARFGSAAGLETFISASMPWHNPGSLTRTEYRQLTAYILRESEATISLGQGPS